MITRVPILEFLLSKTGLYTDADPGLPIELQANGNSFLFHSEGYGGRGEIIGLIGLSACTSAGDWQTFRFLSYLHHY